MPETAKPEGPLRVDILIATCRRAELLRALLDSLPGLVLPEGARPRIVVADNDPAASARGIVEDFAGRCPWPVVYAVEPEKGVSQVRNRLLSLAEGEFAAFVDDDETVEPGWLAALLDTALRYGADVVFGPVPSRLPPAAPGWLRGLFDRPRRPTGSPRETGGAGNVLLRAELLRRAGRGFDPAFGATGGEDTEFFLYLGRLGAKMIWCDEAVAWETVPEERARLSWLLRRSYGVGRIYARATLPLLPAWRGLLSLARCAAGAAVLAVAAPLSLLAGRAAAARLCMRLARGLGRLSAAAVLFKSAGDAA